MDILKRFLEIAEGQIGVEENPSTHEEKMILSYDSTTNLKSLPGLNDEVPWCAAFTNWCVTQAGLQGTNNSMARSWLKWGDPLDKDHPIPGSIVILSRGDDPSLGHVGFYVADGGQYYFRLLSGNTTHQVRYADFSKAHILGVRVPLGYKH